MSSSISGLVKARSEKVIPWSASVELILSTSGWYSGTSVIKIGGGTPGLSITPVLFQNLIANSPLYSPGVKMEFV